MLKKIQEIKKMLEVLEQGMTAATPVNKFKGMTDRELMLELAVLCQVREVHVPLDLYNAIKERTKNV